MADTVTAPIQKYTRVSDVDVIMTIIHPKPNLDLGNLLILNPVTPSADGKAQTEPDKLTDQEIVDGLLKRKTDSVTGAKYVEFGNLDAVRTKYDANTAVYKKAATYFAQDHHSDRVAVLEYDPAKQYDSLKAFWYFNWTFAVITTHTFDDNITALTNIFEINKDHFLVLQNSNVSAWTSMHGQNYTIGLKHDDSEDMDAAFVGAIATRPVGSVTWKFKELKGITPEDLTVTEVETLSRLHAIAYETVAGKAQTSEGWCLSGEYIDVLHGVLWVQTKSESRLENLLQTQGKVPYEQSGINMIVAVQTQVLQEAYERGIIRTDGTTGKADYSVTATPRDQQSLQDLSDRHYGGLSFTYHVQGAIHTITVNGVVNSDTIFKS